MLSLSLFLLPISVCLSSFIALNLKAWRPVGVGFCDGNHGPRQPLCLQRSRKRGGRHERPRGENSSRAGHHRNHPQSFSGHICLHLHLCHLRFSARLDKEPLALFLPPHHHPTLLLPSSSPLCLFLKYLYNLEGLNIQE